MSGLKVGLRETGDRTLTGVRRSSRILADFFDRPAAVVARDLIGVELLLDGVGGIVVETEAYRPDDPASHSFRGIHGSQRGDVRRSRDRVCVSFLRSALVPERCLPSRQRRTHPRDRADIRRRHDDSAAGHDVAACVVRRSRPPVPGPRHRRGFRRPLAAGGSFPASSTNAVSDVVSGPRIGITRAVEQPWRFGLAGSSFLSRRFP